MIQFPISIRDVSPYEGAIRLTGIRPDGLPNGVHTGGAWLYDGMVYKPCDARPYPNYPYHVPTDEAKCLAEMRGKPLFPENLILETLNGRQFIVRKQGLIVPDDHPYSDISLDIIRDIVEPGIRALNLAGWELGDALALAIDPDTYEPYVYDLSNVNRVKNADDSREIDKLLRDCGFTAVANQRQKARHLMSGVARIHERVAGYTHVYASFNRPISSLWATIPDAIYIHHDGVADRHEGIPHTWVVSKAPLSADICYRYELSVGYIPLRVTETKVYDVDKSGGVTRVNK